MQDGNLFNTLPHRRKRKSLRQGCDILKEKEIILESPTTRVRLKASDSDRGLEVHVDGQGQRATFFQNGAQVFGINGGGGGNVYTPIWALSTDNLRILADSIGPAANLDTLLASVLSPTSVWATCAGSNQTSWGLTCLANKVYMSMAGGNQLLQSNKLDTTWNVLGTVTITKAANKFQDGLDWWKVSQTYDAGTNRGFRQQNLTYPSSGATGAFLSFDMFIPPDNEVPVKSLQIALVDETFSVGAKFQDITFGTGFKSNKFYRFGIWFPDSALTGLPGKVIALRIYINGVATNSTAWSNSTAPTGYVQAGTGTFYVKDFQLSFNAPAGWENYTPTGASTIAAGAASVGLANINPWDFRDTDTFLVCFGRNEAEQGTGAMPFSRALERLFYECICRGKNVIYMTPPPKALSNLSGWDPADPYITGGHYSQALKVASKCNVPVIDLIQLFKSSSYNVSQIMADILHQIDFGNTALIIPAIKNELANKRSLSAFRPELPNDIIYYPIANSSTGTWSIIQSGTGMHTPLLGMVYDLVQQSATASSTLTYTLQAPAKQLHVCYRVDPTYGNFTVYINQGKSERSYTFYCNVAGASNWRLCRFVCDNLEAGATITIVKDGTTNPVQIEGILTLS